MTTNAELIDLAMGRLGGRASVRVRATVVSEINATIDTVERGTFFPWFLEQTASLNIVEDDTFVDLPADFAIEADESRPYYVLNGTTYYLTKRFHGTLQGEIPTSVQYYAIHGSEFHFRMAADQAYTIYLAYYARETGNLVDNGSDVANLWLINAKDWIFGEALRTVAATNIQSDGLAAKMAAMGVKAKNDLYVHHEARININQDFEVGGASDGS